MTITEKNTTHLSGLQAGAIVLLLCFWLVSLIIILTKSQATHTITPALLLHTSCLLVLMLLVRVFRGHWSNELAIKKSRFLYLISAILIGMAFWQAQQFLTVLLIPQGWEHDAINWQRAQTGFTLWSVFLASCLIGPFFEELLFRGLIYTQIRHKAGTLLAISISSGMFTLLHWNSSEAVWLFSAAVIYAILREKSGSIWPSVIAHVIQNVLTFWLYVSI